MNIINEAKFYLKELQSIEKHILKENPMPIEREVANKTIKTIWSKFISTLTEQDIEKYKINVNETKLENMLYKLELVIGD